MILMMMLSTLTLTAWRPRGCLNIEVGAAGSTTPWEESTMLSVAASSSAGIHLRKEAILTVRVRMVGDIAHMWTC